MDEFVKKMDYVSFSYETVKPTLFHFTVSTKEQKIPTKFLYTQNVSTRIILETKFSIEKDED